MKEKSLFKISLIGAVVGIFVLYIVSLQIGVDEVQISELEGLKDEENVKIMGVVSRVSNQEKVAFIEVAQEEVKGGLIEYEILPQKEEEIIETEEEFDEELDSDEDDELEKIIGKVIEQESSDESPEPDEDSQSEEEDKDQDAAEDEEPKKK